MQDLRDNAKQTSTIRNKLVVKNFLRSLEKSSFNDAFLARVLYVPSLILLSAENVPSGGWDDTIKEIITLRIVIRYVGDVT